MEILKGVEGLTHPERCSKHIVICITKVKVSKKFFLTFTTKRSLKRCGDMDGMNSGTKDT